MFLHTARLWPLILLSTVCFVGCGGQGDFPETFAADGVVTYNGAAVSNAVVTLSPVDPGGRGASGRTDENGKFTLTTFNPGDGAQAGAYRVKIVPSKLAPGVSAGDQEVVLDNPEQDGIATAATSAVSSELPAKYTQLETSGLETAINQGANTLEFNLSD
ncbi:MAG: hypothetical protein ACF788_05145 [Novipirellula sp. JB048]